MNTLIAQGELEAFVHVIERHPFLIDSNETVNLTCPEYIRCYPDELANEIGRLQAVCELVFGQGDDRYLPLTLTQLDRLTTHDDQPVFKTRKGYIPY